MDNCQTRHVVHTDSRQKLGELGREELTCAVAVQGADRASRRVAVLVQQRVERSHTSSNVGSACGRRRAKQVLKTGVLRADKWPGDVGVDESPSVRWLVQGGGVWVTCGVMLPGSPKWPAGPTQSSARVAEMASRACAVVEMFLCARIGAGLGA
eukprot:1213302-Pleurochrysis_carterae.AAC.1